MKSENFKKELIRIRRQIHRYPELGNQEYRTTGLIEHKLKSLGIKTKRITRTGVVGILKGNGQRSTKCIALRADIDELPVIEQTNKPYESRHPGIMHACGHDAHTTMLLGAAIKLSHLKDRLNGMVKFIFQPNEEGVRGARQMINAGVLKNPHVNAIVGMHVDTQLPTGVVGAKYGTMMAAVGKFEIDIYGGGGHGAYPHTGKDTILCTSEIIQSLQSIVARQINPVEPVVISVCTVNGGTRFNVLANRIVMTGTVRLFNKNLHIQIPRLMHRHISNIVRKHGLKFRLGYEIIGNPLINNKSMVEFSINSVRKVTKVKLIDPVMGGEDFAEYLRYVKGCFLHIGSKGKNNNYPGHHPKFDIDENTLHVGAEVLTQIALDYLN